MKNATERAGLLILGLALLPRVAWVIYRWQAGGPSLEFDDEVLHWQLAENLVQTGTLVSDDGRYVARMPLYPLFLALFAWFGPVGILTARLTQALLGAATAWLAYRLTCRTFGTRCGVFAGVLFALDPYTIFFANLLLTEVPFIFLATGLTACAVRILHTPARAPAADRFVAPGVALLGAAAVMTRPSAAGWIVLLWLLLAWSDRDRWRGIRRVGLYMLVLAMMLVPWGTRNRLVVGSYAWLSANGGVTLYDAQGPQADGSSDQSFLARMPELEGLDEIERDRILARAALRQMAADPLRVVRLAGRKLLRTWNPVPNVEQYGAGLTAIVSALFTIGVMLLAIVGTLRLRSPAPRILLLLWLPVLYFTLVHCVFIGSLRYRIPMMPFLEIAAAGALFVRGMTRRSDPAARD